MSLQDATRRWQDVPGNVRGAAYLLVTALLLTGLSYFIRVAGRSLPALEIIFIRNLIAVLVLAPFAFRRGRPNAFRTRHLRLHLARGTLSFASQICFYWSFINLPLAESTALMYTMPLFVIVLAVAFTGERVGWRRTAATAVGFLGVVGMLAPGMGTLQIALLVPLSIGLIDGTITLVIKRLTRTETLTAILAYMSGVTCVLSGLSLLLAGFAVEAEAIQRLAGWVTPGRGEAALLAVLTLFSLVAQVFNVMGWRAGDATALAPVAYTQIVFAGLMGLVAFGEVPEASAAAGAVVIVGSTLYIARREARLAREAPK